MLQASGYKLQATCLKAILVYFFISSGNLQPVACDLRPVRLQAAAYLTIDIFLGVIFKFLMGL